MNSLGKTVIAAGLLAFMAASPASAKKLTGAEIKSAVPGSYTIVVFGFKIRFNASKGGGLKATFQDESDTGRWSVKGNKLCVSFKTWTNGKTSCSGLDYDGKKWFTADDGTKFFSQ